MACRGRRRQSFRKMKRYDIMRWVGWASVEIWESTPRNSYKRSCNARVAKIPSCHKYRDDALLNCTVIPMGSVRGRRGAAQSLPDNLRQFLPKNSARHTLRPDHSFGHLCAVLHLRPNVHPFLHSLCNRIQIPTVPADHVVAALYQRAEPVIRLSQLWRHRATNGTRSGQRRYGNAHLHPLPPRQCLLRRPVASRICLHSKFGGNCHAE